MSESEFTGVEFHFPGEVAISVERVIDDGNAESFRVCGVDPELMSAAGDGVEGDAGFSIFDAKLLPVGGADLAVNLIVDLMGAVFDIESEGQGDGAFFAR